MQSESTTATKEGRLLRRALRGGPAAPVGAPLCMFDDLPVARASATLTSPWDTANRACRGRRRGGNRDPRVEGTFASPRLSLLLWGGHVAYAPSFVCSPRPATVGIGRGGFEAFWLLGRRNE